MPTSRVKSAAPKARRAPDRRAPRGPWSPNRTRRPVVIKLGGELLEDAVRLRRIARALSGAASGRRIIVVHGGGREVDTEMARLGIQKRAVEGLRITDAETLEVVLGVLAGRVNTRLVAAIGAAGGRAVGLTGADAGLVRVGRTRRYRATDGSQVDLGFVGMPIGSEPAPLLDELCRRGYVPVVASVGSDARGQLYNVNADTLASHLATRLRAECLIVAGATAGVLDATGHTMPELDDSTLVKLIREGQASAGMIAKLLACRAARQGGVAHVAIVDGRRPAAFNLSRINRTGSTTIVADAGGRRSTAQ